MVRWMLKQPQNSKILNCFEIETSEIKLDPPLPSILCPNCKNFLNWGLAGPLPPLIGTMSLNLQVFFLMASLRELHGSDAEVEDWGVSRREQERGEDMTGTKGGGDSAGAWLTAQRPGPSSVINCLRRRAHSHISQHDQNIVLSYLSVHLHYRCIKWLVQNANAVTGTEGKRCINTVLILSPAL